MFAVHKNSIYGAGVEPISPILRQFIGLLYKPWMIDVDDCGANGVMNEWKFKPKYKEKMCRCVAVPL
jgi:hypothetical protein